MEEDVFMVLSYFVVCDNKKLRFVKEKEAGEILSSLEIRIVLDKIPLVGFFRFESMK